MIVAFRAWYTQRREYRFDCATDEEFMEQFASLPGDGFLACKLFYDTFSGKVRHARNISGDEWYWAFMVPGEGIGFDHQSRVTREDIARRYPGAIIKRGKATSEADMARVGKEQADAEYWGDPPLNPQIGGDCCGG